MKWHLSGSGGPAFSLGGSIGRETGSGRVFPDVSGRQARSGLVTYRCLYVENDTEAVLYSPILVAEQTEGSDPVAVGFDPAGKNGRAQRVEDETAEPQGVRFAAPTADSPLSLPGGSYRPGDRVALWLRRTVNPNSRAKKGALVRLTIEADVIEDNDTV